MDNNGVMDGEIRNELNEKTFCHFLSFEMPEKVRVMVIDKMETEDRSRFSGSSKKCNKEAKNSKNYIRMLRLFTEKDKAEIIVKHGIRMRLNPRENDKKGYKLGFIQNNGQKYLECKTLTNRHRWADKLDSSVDLVQAGVQRFLELLQIYQNQIKELWINTLIADIDFGIESLKSLEELSVTHDTTDIRQFFSKMQKPLQSLFVLGKENGKILENCAQLYEVQRKIHSPYTCLNYQQFLRLSAPRVAIHIGRLTESDIYSLIKSWKNGTIEIDKIGWYEWNLEGSRFDVRILFRGFGEKYEGSEMKEVHLRHDNAPKTAIIQFMEHSLTIRIISDQPNNNEN